MRIYGSFLVGEHVVLLDEQIGKTNYGIERSSYLVAHGCEEAFLDIDLFRKLVSLLAYPLSFIFLVVEDGESHATYCSLLVAYVVDMDNESMTLALWRKIGYDCYHAMLDILIVNGFTQLVSALVNETEDVFERNDGSRCSYSL